MFPYRMPASPGVKTAIDNMSVDVGSMSIVLPLSSPIPTLDMYELGITQNIVAIVAENAGDRPVKRITQEIGQLSAIMADAIEFCFDVCNKGMVLEGATLEILEIPGLGKCR